MLTGLLAAAATTVAYGVATVLQAVASRRLAVAPVDPRLVLRLLRQLPYLAAMVLDAVGFAASVVALQSMPLFLVQSAVAASIGVTALAARIWLGARLGRREGFALAVMGVGLVLLASSAESEGAQPMSRTGQWLLLGLSVLLGGVSVLAGRAPARQAAAGLAVAAGLGFSTVGIATRALHLAPPWWPILLEPLLWALAISGIVATTCYAAALQRGSVTVVAAVTLAVETILPAVVGYAALGDRARPGFLPAAVLGLLLALGGAIGLARYAEPEPSAAAAAAA
jgi:drug/metabolite transporter (DMT)-like permease